MMVITTIMPIMTTLLMIIRATSTHIKIMPTMIAQPTTTRTIITPLTSSGTSTLRESGMFDDFFIRAILAGVGLALTTGPLGCFIIWRRMAYFGDTIAHSALLGVALSLLMQFNLTLSVFAVAAAVSILLLVLQKRQALSADALLGILSHATLAIGLVMVAFMSWVRIDLIAFLFGDILAVSKALPSSGAAASSFWRRSLGSGGRCWPPPSIRNSPKPRGFIPSGRGCSSCC
jgi:hypothetical protein